MFKSKEGRKELLNSIFAILIALIFLFPIFIFLIKIISDSDQSDPNFEKPET